MFYALDSVFWMATGACLMLLYWLSTNSCTKVLDVLMCHQHSFNLTQALGF